MARKREPRDKRKRNESDFTLQIQDLTDKGKVEVEVIGGRVLTIPRRTRTLKIGKGSSKIILCLHGKPTKQTCPTCEFEAPIVKKKMVDGTAFV